MTKKALLIGINYKNTENELNGCINDIQNIKSEAWKNAWLVYRQQLRNLPELYDQNYDMTFKIQNVIFPNKP